MVQANLGIPNYFEISDIQNLFLSPNKKILATINEKDLCFKLWSLETHTLIRKFPKHPEKIESIQFSPCGSYVCSLQSTVILLWKIFEKKFMKKIFLGGEEFNSAAFSPCSKYLVATSGCNLYAWDLQGLSEPIFHFICESDITNFAISKSGKLISIAWDDYVEVRSVQQNKRVLMNKGAEWIVITMDFSPFDKYICWYGYSSTVNLWDLQMNEVIKDFGYECGLVEVCFSSCGQYIIGASWHDRAIIWEIGSKNPIREIRKDQGLPSARWFSLSGTVLSYLCFAEVKFLDIGKIKPLKPTFCSHSVTAFSPCGSYFASGGNDNTIKIWQSYPFELKRSLEGQKSEATCLSFSPCGYYLASGSSDGILRLWSATKKEILKAFSDFSYDMDNEIYALSYAMDSERLALIGPKVLAFWKSKNSQILASESLLQDCYTTLKFSPSKTYFAYGCREKEINVLSTKTSRLYANFKGHESAILALDFSLDEDLLISSSEDASVIVWDLKQKKQRAKLIGHDGIVTCLCCSPCGKFLITGGRDRMIKIWNIKTLALVSESKAHASEINSISISPHVIT